VEIWILRRIVSKITKRLTMKSLSIVLELNTRHYLLRLLAHNKPRKLQIGVAFMFFMKILS